MTAPQFRAVEAHTGTIATTTRGIDELLAERDTIQQAFAAAVGFYDCPCGSAFEFIEDSTLEDYASLNRWLGAHVPCPSVAVAELERQLDWETGR